MECGMSRIGEWQDICYNYHAHGGGCSLPHALASIFDTTEVSDMKAIDDSGTANRARPQQKRKKIPKSVRFEVFKRDSFTCQYCGAQAPEAVLHVDHIKPVSNGGDNSIINLVTSCVSCNLGKGAKELGDNSVLGKQKAQLDELNERRIQLEMLMEYRSQLQSSKEDSLNRVVETIESLGGYYLSQSGKKIVKQHIRKYGIQEVLDAVEISADEYLSVDQNGEVHAESFDLFFNKIGGICFVRMKEKELPGYSELVRIKAILKRRFPYTNLSDAMHYLEAIYKNGYSIDTLRDVANLHRSWAEMRGDILSRLSLQNNEGSE